MKKNLMTAVTLVTIFLFIEMALAKPLDNSEISKNRGVTATPGTGLSEHGTDYMGSNYADSTETYAPDEKINEGLISDEANSLTTNLRPVLNEIEHRVTKLKPESVKPGLLPVALKPGNEKLDSLLTTSEKGSWTASSLITTLEPVYDGNASLVTSLESSSGEPDSLVITLEPGIASTTEDIGSGEPGSLSTTFEADSGRQGGSATTPFDTLPVKNGHRNGASFIRSSFVVVLLGLFLITGSHVT